MTIDLLSIILIVIAALGVIGLLLALFYRKQDHSMEMMEEESSEDYEEEMDDTQTAYEKDRIEPTISKTPIHDPELAALGFNTMDVLPASSNVKVQMNPTAETITPEIVSTVPVQPEIKPTILEPEKKATNQKAFINFYIVAPSNEPFMGYELHQALLAAELRFGKMNIFHRHENADGSGEILFSIASAVPPGIFDIANIGGFSCPGLSVFTRPDKTKNPREAFDLMVETAHQLVEELGGQLCDEESRQLSASDIAEMRNQIQ